MCTLAINFADYSTQVYAAYTTSAFKQHSAMSAARVVMNIARISAYPVVAKLGDVSILEFDNVFILLTVMARFLVGLKCSSCPF